MSEITITVRDKVAKGDGTYYVCGNGDYTVRFSFDEEWVGIPAKTARFVKEDAQHVDVIFQGDECAMPILLGTRWIYVGVFAGDLKTTTPAAIRARKSILDMGGIPEEPSPDVYAQIMKKLNSIEGGMALPGGGIEGQALCKNSETDHDVAWKDIPRVEKTSQLINDSGFITGYTETDPTVPAWAKATTKPSYTKSEVGLGNVENVKQYSASNPPPYPVSSVNGKTGVVSLSASDVGARPSSWTPTAANVGAVPTSRKVNGKALSANITLSAADVGAVPTTSTLTVTGVDADGVTHTWTMYGVSV